MSTRLFQSLSRATKKTELWSICLWSMFITTTNRRVKTIDIDRTQVLNDGTRSDTLMVLKQNDRFREYVTKQTGKIQN